MSDRPRALNIGLWLAWILFAFALLGILNNPWSPLLGLPWALAALGLSHREAWSGYGPALWQGSMLGWLGYRLVTDRLAAATLTWELASSFGLVLLIGFLMYRAGRSAERASGARSGSPWGWVALTVSMVVFLTALQPFRIPTAAMEKTILLGDHILVRNAPGVAPARRDLVVFRYPVDRRQTFVKRVVGLPGDRIRIAGKKLYVNGEPQDESYAFHGTQYIDNYRDNFPSEANLRLYRSGETMLSDNVVAGEVKVPPGKYFVMGDNRDSSLDSRYWGFIERADIIGRPWMIYFSAEANTDQEMEPLALDVTIMRWRWDRFFRRLQ